MLAPFGETGSGKIGDRPVSPPQAPSASSSAGRARAGCRRLILTPPKSNQWLLPALTPARLSVKGVWAGQGGGKPRPYRRAHYNRTLVANRPRYVDTRNPALAIDCPNCGLRTARFMPQ